MAKTLMSRPYILSSSSRTLCCFIRQPRRPLVSQTSILLSKSKTQTSLLFSCNKVSSNSRFGLVGERKLTTRATHVNDAGSIDSPLMQSMEKKVFRYILALGEQVVSLQEEHRIAEEGRVKADKLRMEAEKTIIRLVREKKELDSKAGQAKKDLERVRKELEAEVNRSTRRALERNELRIELAAAEGRAVTAIARAAEAEAGADKSFEDGYYLAQLHVAQHTSPNFDLHQIRGWSREEILTGADGVPKVTEGQSSLPGGGDATSSSDPARSDKKGATGGRPESPPVESGKLPVEIQEEHRPEDLAQDALLIQLPIGSSLPVEEPASPMQDQ